VVIELVIGVYYIHYTSLIKLTKLTTKTACTMTYPVQRESVKELQWFCERLDLKHIVDKRRLFLKGLLKSHNTVLQVCFGLFTHSREFVQLCYKYDVNVALCSSGAIFAAVCSDFSQVVFSQL